MTALHCIELVGAITRIAPTTTLIVDTSYAVALLNASLPAAAWYFQFYLYVVFALCERKTTYIQKEKYRCT